MQNIFITFVQFPVSNKFASNCLTYDFRHSNGSLFIDYQLQYDNGKGEANSINNIGAGQTQQAPNETLTAWEQSGCNNQVLSTYLCNFLGTTQTGVTA